MATDAFTVKPVPRDVVTLQVDVSGVRERAEFILDLPRPVLWLIVWAVGMDAICAWCARKAKVIVCGRESPVS